MNGCWILSNTFSASVEFILWFCLFFCWCGVSHYLICICWTILVTLGWIQLGCGVWSFLCVIGFSFLIFCWEFLYLYSSKILACNFGRVVLSLPDFGIRVMMASYCSWGSQGKNTEVVCYSFLQWTEFCQNTPPWPVCFGWHYMDEHDSWFHWIRQGCGPCDQFD